MEKTRTLTMSLIGTIALTAIVSSVAPAATITIENSIGQPIANADILIGDTAPKPFADNRERTDAQGAFSVPAQWTTPQMMTIEANGYITTTFLNVAPQSAVYQVNAVDSTSNLAIKGATTGFQHPGRGGKMDFALVYPALSRRQLAQFDVDAVISPQFDKIPVMITSVSVPSNLTIPDQTQNYFFPIEFNKPNYTMFVRDPGQYKMVAIHGKFPFSQVVDELRGGKSFYDVLNKFQFINGGERDVTVSSSGTNQQNIAVDQMTFDNHISVQAPEVPDGMAMVALPMAEESGVYYATDLKQVSSQQSQNLAVSSQSSAHNILSLLMPKSKTASENMKSELSNGSEIGLDLIIDRLIRFVSPGAMGSISQRGEMNDSTTLTGQSVAFQNSHDGLAQFLPLVAPPVPNSDGTITLTPPDATTRITPVATYVVLSRIDPIDAGKYHLSRRYRLFESYSMGWISNMKIPHVLNPLQKGKTYRWEVYYLGRNSTAAGSKYFLDTVTHVSRNSFDFTE